MKSLFRSLFIVLLCASASMAVAQDAEDIIKDYLKASGGEKEMAAITTIKMVGESTSPRGNAPMTIIKKAPNKNKMLISPMGTDMTMAYDGETAWMINPWAGGAAKILEGPEAKMVPQDEIENPFVNYVDKGHTVKLLGEEDVNDEAHYKVRLTKKSGDEIIYYFNADTGLPSQMKMLLTEGQAKGSILVTTFEDYKKIDGFMMPFTSDRIIDGVSTGKYVIAEIMINEEIPDSEFTFPEKKE